MKELNTFREFLTEGKEEKVNEEYSIEYRAYDHLKKLYALIEDSREKEGDEAALGIVDYAISYLKNIEYSIKTKEGELNESLLARALANLGMSPEKLHELLDNVVDQLESTIPADKKEKFDQAVEITRDKIDRGAIQKPNQVIAVFKEIFD